MNVLIQKIIVWGLALCLVLMLIAGGKTKHFNIFSSQNAVKNEIKNIAEVYAGGGKLKSEDFQVRVTDLLRKDPLNSGIFLLGFWQHNDPEYLKFAKSRNARNLVSISHKLTRHLEDKEFDKAVQELDLLYRVELNKREEYAQYFAFLYLTTDAKENIENMLKREPLWHKSFGERLVKSANARGLLDIRNALPLIHKRDDWEQLLYTAYLRKMVKQGYTGEAYAFWQQHAAGNLTAKDVSIDNMIFNSTFLKDVSIAPFDWRIYSSKNGYYEHIQPFGVFISHSAKVKNWLLSQIVPNQGDIRKPYKFKYDIDFTKISKYGTLSWDITCVDKPKIRHRQIIKQDKAEQNFEFKFDQPCDFFEVRLLIEPGTYSRRMNITVNKVKMSQ